MSTDAVLGLRDQRRDAISQLLAVVRGEIDHDKLLMQFLEPIQRSRFHSIGGRCLDSACHAIQVSSRLVPVLSGGMAKQHAARGRFERIWHSPAFMSGSVSIQCGSSRPLCLSGLRVLLMSQSSHSCHTRPSSASGARGCLGHRCRSRLAPLS